MQPRDPFDPTPSTPAPEPATSPASGADPWARPAASTWQPAAPRPDDGTATDWSGAARQHVGESTTKVWSETGAPAEPRFEARTAGRFGGIRRSPGGRRPFGTVIAAAVLAAVLASGSTVAIVSVVRPG